MNKKNIVILLVDAFRPKNMSLFGYHRETDKFLKELALNNLVFENHFSTSNATAPAITSILTGTLPPTHGIIHQLPYTKPEEMKKVEEIKFWLPSHLKDKGYETICIDWVGLWFKKGFDFYGEQENPYAPRQTKSPFISAKETIDLAISKIKDCKNPFFLFTHFWDTHFPFPNTEHISNSTKEDQIKMLNGIEDPHQREYLKKRIDGKNLFTIQDMTNKYDSSIEEIDRQIRRLKEFLEEKGEWENTLFLVLGDHGDSLTEHGTYFSHAGLYDVSIHVPLIMRLPGFSPKRIKGLTQHTDLVPTILEVIGIKADEKFEGASMVPLIKENQEIREKVFSFDGLGEDIISERTKKEKKIIARNNFCFLCKGSHHKSIERYNLEVDPEEKNNLEPQEETL